MTDPSPESSRDSGEGQVSRRTFLSRLSLGLGALGTMLVGVPVVGFVLSPMLRKPTRKWVGVGAVDRFSSGETVSVRFREPSATSWAGVTGETAAWVRREGQNEFIAFVVNCTHLGCPVRWEAEAKLFLCPCHGGIYYSDGKVAGGPPPRPLHRYKTRVHNGQLQIQTRPIPITTV